MSRRSARQGRSARAEPSSRAGQFWDTNFETIYALPGKVIKTKTDFFNKHGLGSKLNHDVLDATYLRRKCELLGCNEAEILVDSRGFSYCPICRTVYNDGSPPIRSRTSDQLIEKSRVQRSKMVRACKG